MRYSDHVKYLQGFVRFKFICLFNTTTNSAFPVLHGHVPKISGPHTHYVQESTIDKYHKLTFWLIVNALCILYVYRCLKPRIGDMLLKKNLWTVRFT